jgi:hypothetical protein
MIATMKRKRPVPWWTEYLGLTIGLRFFARKTWKAYALYIAPILYILFAQTPTLPSKPHDSEPHLPSSAIDGSKTTHVVPPTTIAIKVADDVRVMDHEIVKVAKLPGRTFIVPLTGTLRISARAMGATLTLSPAKEV